MTIRCREATSVSSEQLQGRGCARRTSVPDPRQTPPGISPAGSDFSAPNPRQTPPQPHWMQHSSLRTDTSGEHLFTRSRFWGIPEGCAAPCPWIIAPDRLGCGVAPYPGSSRLSRMRLSYGRHDLCVGSYPLSTRISQKCS